MATTAQSEYPFFTTGVLRRHERKDACAANHQRFQTDPHGQFLDWLIDEAGLTAEEVALVQFVRMGNSVAMSSRLVSLPERRGLRMFRRAIAKLSAKSDELSSRAVYENLMRSNGTSLYHREQHCKNGSEMCRKYGYCPARS